MKVVTTVKNGCAAQSNSIHPITPRRLTTGAGGNPVTSVMSFALRSCALSCAQGARQIAQHPGGNRKLGNGQLAAVGQRQDLAAHM